MGELAGIVPEAVIMPLAPVPVIEQPLLPAAYTQLEI